MNSRITLEQLTTLGLHPDVASKLLANMEAITKQHITAEACWQQISTTLLNNTYPFSVHLLIFNQFFPQRHQQPESAPGWIPDQATVNNANITKLMQSLQIHDVKTFHRYTTAEYAAFWQMMTEKLHIQFKQSPTSICDLTNGIESPRWFLGATLNIVDSCFTASPQTTAICYLDTNSQLCAMTYGELQRLVNQVANSLSQLDYHAGDSIGIAMPMNPQAVAIYLGIIKMGGVVVSVPDSFSQDETAIRMKIANAKIIFTQDHLFRGQKKFPLYEKMPHNIKTIVLPAHERLGTPLRNHDLSWDQFLQKNDEFSAVERDPMAATHILFSSGTTGEPKAIVWNQTTAIKAASDAYLHQNIQAQDVLLWPTSLGWMMGPWLVYAALINHATLALYTDAPKDHLFGEFVQNAQVTMLGVVPTLVASWRQSKCMEGLDWHHIKVFSSTGECSNPDDMLYLMALAGYKPVIEYCGGTEIGGAYISSTIVENNYPSLFSTPTMGLDIAIIDDHGKTADVGEVAIIPPSIGLSTELLNFDHHQIYYEKMPNIAGRILRRHGDQIKRYSNGYYSVIGRVDDTMNLGGIKISSAEIERVLAGIPNITESAAIAVSPRDNGPSLLVIFAATSSQLDKPNIVQEMQKRINTRLNPLFKIHDVVFTADLPKTASNKIMRRVLRDQYQQTIL